MKSTKLKMAAVAILAAIGLFAFTAVSPKLTTGSIKGTISPATAAANVVAISGMDSTKATIDNGSFNINDIRQGTYKLVVTAVPPYKNFEKEGIMVSDGKATDVGEISLQK
jgi:hypothetical protein